MSQRQRVVVAMSGGVDSSVAAALLLREGYDVTGVFMRLGTPEGVEPADETCDPRSTGHRGCCSVRDAQDARRVANLLGIPFFVLNFQDDFGRVIDYFVSEYNAGRTPNPCVRCNDWLKFGKLNQYAKAIDAQFVASGHYARIGTHPTGRRILRRGKDLRKDQSYVLFGITPDAVQHTLFPVGELEKPEVRAIAEELRLPVFDKPDSQEICFVPDDDYPALVRRRSPQSMRPGTFVDAQGQTLGTHPGHQSFTIGQRKGLKIALGARAYVVDIDPQSNQVTLGTKADLLRRTLIADQVNITHPDVVEGEPIRCHAKVRYNQQPQPATMRIDAGQMDVTFDEPQSAITPGQAAVAYRGDELLCGGWIVSAANTCRV